MTLANTVGTDEEKARMQELIVDMATTSIDWSDERMAGQIVEMLILDKGLINAWQRTIITTIEILRVREALLADRRHHEKLRED